MSDLPNIESCFNDRFATWKIRLPPEDIALRRRGRLLQAGWTIWYLFGADDQGEYLDVYASHRMTFDSHTRLREHGAPEELPAVEGIFQSSDDPEEAKRLLAEYCARNQCISALLAAKGFTLQGDEPPMTAINRYLQTHPHP